MKIKFLIVILFIASFLRLWKLGSIPSSLSPDEAALGYNAYSILKTGKDEFGQILPVIFKSFGDYKPGLYIYFSIPFIATLGLNELSVRLVSAISGIISIYLIYLIISLLIPKNRTLALLGALTASVNPWLIYFSRGAWEANLSLSLTLAGLYFFLKALTNSKYLIYSSIFLSLTFLTYQGAKLSTSLVLLILVIIFRKEIKAIYRESGKRLISSMITGLLIISPIIFSLFAGKTGRLNVFSLFSYPRPLEYTQNFLKEGGEKIGDLYYYLFHSESLNFTRGVMGRFYNHYSGKFLFFEGDYQNPMHSAPNMGMLLLIDLILIPLGAIWLVRNRSKFSTLTFLWLILAPLPAVLSRDQVQSVRAINMAVPLVFLSAAGIYALNSWVRGRSLKFIVGLVSVVLYSGSILYFLDSYFVHFPVHNAKYWSYGYKQAFGEIALLKYKYDKIIFQQSYSQPYIYFLFFQRYDPINYQKQGHFKSGGADVGLVEKLDNIEFRAFSWPPGIENERTLVVGDTVAIPDYFSSDSFDLVKEIKYPDGYSIAFRILEKI